MVRTFLRIGFFLWMVAVWGFLAGAAGWIPRDRTDAWGRVALGLGAAFVAGGVILWVAAPLGRILRGSRCARCSRPTDRGHVYCQDHLKETIEEFRDHLSEGPARGRPGRS